MMSPTTSSLSEAFDEIDGILPDDEALAALLEIIVERLESSRVVPNPVDTTEDLAHRLSSTDFAAFMAKLRQFASVADDAVGAADD